MTAVERPVKKALGDALDIYRDAMRPFVIRNLKRVPGRSAKDAIGAALRDGQYNQFEQNLKDGRGVEDAIDIGEFPQLIKKYWRDAFHDAFRRRGRGGERRQPPAHARSRPLTTETSKNTWTKKTTGFSEPCCWASGATRWISSLTWMTPTPNR